MRLRRLLGHAQVEVPRCSGRAAVPLKKAAGLTHFVRCTVQWRDGELWATPLQTQVSGALRSVAQATHLLVLPKDATRIESGQPVELIPASWAP